MFRFSFLMVKINIFRNDFGPSEEPSIEEPLLGYTQLYWYKGHITSFLHNLKNSFLPDDVFASVRQCFLSRRIYI